MPSANRPAPSAPVASNPVASGRAGKTNGNGTQEAPQVRSPWLIAAALVTVLGLVATLIFGGAAASQTLLDPGPLVRWGLPVVLAIHNVALACVVGALLFAVVILPRNAQRASTHDKSGQKTELHPAFTRALALAGAASVVWTVAAIAVLIFTYLDQAGVALSTGPDFTQGLVFFMTQLPAGQAWLVTTVIAAIVSTFCFGVRSLTGLGLTLVLTLIGLVPQALIGHSASSTDHSGGVNSLLLHITGVALWVGGLVALAVVSGTLRSTDPRSSDVTRTVLTRFSSLALFAFVLVAASGVVNSSIRLTSWGLLFGSSYGQIILVKAGATVCLGVIGFVHRQWLIPRLGDGAPTGQKPARTPHTALKPRRVLWQLIGVEAVLMGFTSGVAVGLSRSAPPQSTEILSTAPPVEILTGYPMPPELTPIRWLTEWRPDWLWLTVIIGGAVAYLLGVRKLRQRGDSWSWLSTVSWLVGLLALTYITSGPPAVYGLVLFSAHMVDHMALTMVAPLFLVMGAPVSLALKALTPRGDGDRGDGSRGLREWILVVVHSRFSAVVTNPLFAAANFAGSIILFYYTPLFGFALRQHVGHELMYLHFTITGYLFVLSLIGLDPVPRRLPYPLRLVLLLATMAFHAFFGVAIMSSNALLQASYFGNLGRTWGLSAIADQQMGGAVAWGIGEVPTVLVAIAVAVTWSRSDARETKRTDRAADRNNNADLAAYNDMFARLAERDAGQVRAQATRSMPTHSNERTPSAPAQDDPATGEHE